MAALWATAREFVSAEVMKPVEAQLAVAEVSEPPKPQEITLLFVGDIMAHLPQVESARRGEEQFDFYPHLEGVAQLFGSADFVVGNLETTLTPRPPYCGYPAFATPEELAADMRRVGFDLVTLANNHIADCGVEGALATMAALDNHSIDHLGVAVPSVMVGECGVRVVDIEGFRVGFFAATYGINGPLPRGMELSLTDTVAMARRLDALTQRVDCLVALVHWGEEYARRESARQRRVAKWLRSRGVDVVVGSHPHVVQPSEVWHNEAGESVGGVYYSLGNFISNQNSPHTDCGLAARVRLTRMADGEVAVALGADTLRRVRHIGPEHTSYGVEVVGDN